MPLQRIGAAIRRTGHGVFQFAPEHARLPVDEWPWMPERLQTLADPERRRRIIEDIPDDGGLLRAVVRDKLARIRS